jgi:hypothetical protein
MRVPLEQLAGFGPVYDEGEAPLAKANIIAPTSPIISEIALHVSGARP